MPGAKIQGMDYNAISSAGDSGDSQLAKKKEAYRLMDAATEDSDEEVDAGRHASAKAMMKPTGPAKRRQSHGSLSRSTSDHQVDGRLKQQPTSTAPPASSKSSTFSRALDVSASSEKPMPPKMTGKRKRKEDVEIPMKTNGIFSNLHFYFFPNTDKHPGRKLRIAKAIEHGATWEKAFSKDVTHVIVDKGMNFAQLLKFLKRESLPDGIPVVSEDYPAECISYRTLLNPRGIQFKVKGYEPAAEKQPVSFESDKSLQLKKASKSIIARQPSTPEKESDAGSPPPDNEAQHEQPSAPVPVNNVDEKPTAAPTTVASSNEELELAIRQARVLKDVPLDSDDEAESRPTSSEGTASDREEGQGGLELVKRRKTKYQRLQDKFQCFHKHTGAVSESPNAATIAMLQQVADYYGQMGEEWRLRSYRKAISTLRNHPTKVITKEEARALPNVGERLAAKIEEIAVSNRLRRWESVQSDPNDQIFRTFNLIYGVGPAQASKWVAAGYKTLDELAEKADLNENQRIGLDHYEDFNSRIPRAEVERHGAIVRKALQQIDPAFEVIVGGSYRRGSETSGDIDCIITRPNTGAGFIREAVLDKLVPKLFAQKFLVAELAATSRDDGSKWHGASQLPGTSADGRPNPWRRIDFLLVPSDEIGAALIYFTGNDIFNRSLRLLASTKGMRLNQRGLYKDVIRGKGRVKLSEGTLMEGKDEKKIFEILGVPWRPPEHRIC